MFGRRFVRNPTFIVNHPLALFGYFIIAVGLAPIVLSMSSCGQRRTWNENSIAATGKVIDVVQQKEGPDDQLMIVPVVKYLDSLGHEITTVPQHGDAEPTYSIGEVVNIRYSIFYPDEITIDAYESKHDLTLIYAAIGLATMLVGCFVFVYASDLVAEREQKMLSKALGD